jgi:hypothetical protein
MWGRGSLDVIVILILPTDPWANRVVPRSLAMVPPLHVERSSSVHCERGKGLIENPNNKMTEKDT